MSANLSANFLALQAQVTQTTTVEGSALTLIQGLSAQLALAITAANNGDTAALPALQTQLATSAAALSAGITANTPAAGGVGVTGTAPAAPAIFTQPVASTVTAPATATFTVVATGTAPISYQWSKTGQPISGATSATYVTPPTVSTDNGATFTAVVTNAQGSVTSAAAILTVNS